MRKVRLALNVSLDGYVARPNGALDWVFRTMTPSQQAWTTAFLREVDTIVSAGEILSRFRGNLSQWLSECSTPFKRKAASLPLDVARKACSGK